jgi:5'(3')-deoxyribonucleotidase
MKKLLLGVDVDLTVVDPVTDPMYGWVQWYKAQTGHDIFEEVQGKEFHLDDMMHNHHDPMMFWKNPHLYDLMVPMDNSVEVLRELSEKYTIAFISHCMPEHHHSKHLFLKRHFPFMHGFIDTGDKHLVRPDIMIDDYSKYLRQVKDFNRECRCIKIKSVINKKSEDFEFLDWNEILTELK